MNKIWRVIGCLCAGRVSTRIDGPEKTIYLTFDDGPHAQHTPGLMDALERFDARGTFFLVGAKIAAHREMLLGLVGRGHSLANHSFSHTLLSSLDLRQMREDVAQAEIALRNIDGRTNHFLRPPWGKITLLQLLSCLLQGGRIALWSRDSLDYKESAGQIVRGFRERPPVSGDVILFHDDGPVAREVLLQMIPEWRNAGFKMQVLPGQLE